MFDGEFRGLERPLPVHLVVCEQHAGEVLEGQPLLARTDEPPLAHLADPLLEQLASLRFVVGMRALTVLLSSVAVCDPVRRTTFENPPKSSHRFNPRPLRDGCFRRKSSIALRMSSAIETRSSTAMCFSR